MQFFSGIEREPEFKKDFEEVQRKCSTFAVAILDVCQNSQEVEMVLGSRGVVDGIKPKYNLLSRALYEEQKEFIAHSYCQLLLNSK